MNLIAQLIGIIAMGFNIISYQFKRKRDVLLCQMVGGALFAVNMFMLDAVSGFVLNVLAAIRAVVYICSEKYGWNVKRINLLFMIAFMMSYVSVFTVFDVPVTVVRLVIELLPVIGMVALTIGFSKTDAKSIRLYGSISSPSWLVYNCINFSIGGIICETISIISIITAYFRLDKNSCEVSK